MAQSSQQTSQLYPLSDMNEQVMSLLELSKSQLQVLELAKNEPGILDKAILSDAIETVRDQETVFSFFRKECNRWQKQSVAEGISRKMDAIKEALYQLEKNNKQIMFLMDNLLEFAGDHAYTDEDLENLPDILEVLKNV